MLKTEGKLNAGSIIEPLKLYSAIIASSPTTKEDIQPECQSGRSPDLKQSRTRLTPPSHLNNSGAISMFMKPTRQSIISAILADTSQPARSYKDAAKSEYWRPRKCLTADEILRAGALNFHVDKLLEFQRHDWCYSFDMWIGRYFFTPGERAALRLLEQNGRKAPSRLLGRTHH